MDRVDYHLAEADERLETARILLDHKRPKDAIGRAYYAMYHAARAILLTRDISPRTHKGLIQKFGEVFVKTELVSKKYSVLLSKAESLREMADYDVIHKFTMEEAEVIVSDADKFIEKIEKILEKEG
ncbi:HEPN domain protein [archaeon BMS3Abin16]|nr:HEPN domain protein [archaeon BMS3Abin16]HDY74732.1 HEPN domain-containing protein [Euryarchaeota archaeon]